MKIYIKASENDVGPSQSTKDFILDRLPQYEGYHYEFSNEEDNYVNLLQK